MRRSAASSRRFRRSFDEEEQPTVFERAAGMSRGRRGFEDSGTSAGQRAALVYLARRRRSGADWRNVWKTPSFGERCRLERRTRMSGWGGVNGSGNAGSSRTLIHIRALIVPAAVQPARHRHLARHLRSRRPTIFPTARATEYATSNLARERCRRSRTAARILR